MVSVPPTSSLPGLVSTAFQPPNLPASRTPCARFGERRPAHEQRHYAGDHAQRWPGINIRTRPLPSRPWRGSPIGTGAVNRAGAFYPRILHESFNGVSKRRPAATWTENVLVARPAPPCHSSKPASTSIRYHDLLM